MKTIVFLLMFVSSVCFADTETVPYYIVADGVQVETTIEVDDQYDYKFCVSRVGGLKIMCCNDKVCMPLGSST